MTAEIAILNKYAVALAADSAVTISAGSKEEKIFDSGDKLFELSNANPIGIMIYNGMDFVDVPLPVLIKKFRSTRGQFNTVRDAAYEFLQYLNDVGKKSSKTTKEAQIGKIVEPVVRRILALYAKRFEEEIINAGPSSFNAAEEVQKKANSILEECVRRYERLLETRKDAEFVGDGKLQYDRIANKVIVQIVDGLMARFDNEIKSRVVKIGRSTLIKDIPSRAFTGIVVAGFGSTELFPTLISFEIDGMVSDRLKYVQKEVVDIDRGGPRSSVLPFAQKEMVERFLYGLDEKSQQDIAGFCEQSVPEISQRLLDQLQFADAAEKQELEKEAKQGEAAFVMGLREKAFAAIRSQSQAEIEDMVEFMPKPELARMAEALVNLTSIKRRVSRGVETVGGPIDVAVVSHAEGFVWVKRKHYFPGELNPRYFERVKSEASHLRRTRDVSFKPSRTPRAS